MHHLRKRKGSGRPKYVKVPIKTKLRFLRKVVLEGFSIKDSATIFDINYSTAKTLIGQYKTQAFPWSLTSFPDEQDLEVQGWKMKRCGYRQVVAAPFYPGENLEGRSSSFQLSGSSPLAEEAGLKVVSFLQQQIQIISSTTQQ